jgi:hypothetical protein
MVEGGDRTDRSSACGGSGDDGRKPDGPKKFDRHERPECPSKSAGDWNPFPTPRLTVVEEPHQDGASQGVARDAKW